MVTGTTTGNLRERFVKRPRQTSIYNRYGPWRCYDSAPRKGPSSGWRGTQKIFLRALIWGGWLVGGLHRRLVNSNS